MKTQIVLKFNPIDVGPNELDMVLRDLTLGWVREDMRPMITEVVEVRGE